MSSYQNKQAAFVVQKPASWRNFFQTMAPAGLPLSPASLTWRQTPADEGIGAVFTVDHEKENFSCELANHRFPLQSATCTLPGVRF
jgi:hypothetical protein